jgi:hypothetical protein
MFSVHDTLIFLFIFCLFVIVADSLTNELNSTKRGFLNDDDRKSICQMLFCSSDVNGIEVIALALEGYYFIYSTMV